MKKIESEQQLISLLKTGGLIVLDQLIYEFYFYSYDSNGCFQKETIDLSGYSFECIEDWSEQNIISRNTFISRNTLMAVSYSQWYEPGDGIQDDGAKKLAIKMGL